jgi:hypothetical protein
LQSNWIKRLTLKKELATQGGVCALFTFIILGFSGVTLLLTLPFSVFMAAGVQYWLFVSNLWAPIICAVGCGIFFGLLARIMLGNPIYGGLRRR